VTQYDVVGYHQIADPAPLPFAVFAILQLDSGSFRPFDPIRHGLTVAGMLHYATKIRAESAGWSRECIDACILGHGEARGSVHVSVGASRFAFLPLPSIEIRGGSQANVIGSIRRAMLTALSGDCEQEMVWAQRVISGQPLIDERTQRPVAILSTIPPDAVVRRYTGPAVTWASVTPVVLPGYDDPAHYRRRLKRGTTAEEQRTLLSKLEDRTDALLRKAIVQAGLPQELADHAELEWRKTGFWVGTELADAYGVPDHLKRFPRVHVRIRWRDMRHQPLKVAGPLCLGGGRFCGLGLLAGV